MDIYQRVKGFLSQGVWSTDIADIPWFKAFAYRAVRFLEHAATGFVEDRCFLRASALTYSSLLSLIPFLAIVFAFLKGFGAQDRLEAELLEWVSKFTPTSQEVVTQILEYIDRTNVSSLGVAGVVMMLITVVMVLKNMERAFNWIWHVQRGRNWQRTVSDYISVLIIVPMCLLVALSLTTYFQSERFVQLMGSLSFLGGFVQVLGGIVKVLIKLSPFFIMWVAFAACYLLMPNTQVKAISAIFGGIVGGTLYQFAQWGYVNYQIGVSKYNAIYGALSQLPLLMVWIYVGWLILLFGAEIAFAHQNLEKYTTEKRVLSAGREDSRAFWLLQILKSVGERFQRGEDPYSVEDLRERLQMPRSLLDPYLEKLERLRWIAHLDGNAALVVFRCPPSNMPLHSVLGFELGDQPPGREEGLLVGILRRTDEGIQTALGSLTVQDLIEQPATDYIHIPSSIATSENSDS
jgi:membrane protein